MLAITLGEFLASPVGQILVVSGIGAGLAALLVAAERYVAAYGDVDVVINDGQRDLHTRGGRQLLETLTAEKIFIPSACGGRGTCAYCKVKVLEGGGPVAPTEEPLLSKQEREQGIRLSCQVKVRNNIRIEIPPDLLSVREYACRVEKITELTYDTKELRLKLLDPADMAYIPGQYVQLFTPKYKGNSEEVYRAYSISANPADKGYVELIVRRVPGGICTTYVMDHLKEGDTAKVNGPYGEFRLTDNDRPIIFIAGGSGMAPIKCILHHMANTRNTREAIYFFGANTTKDLFMVDRMTQFEQEVPNFRFMPVIAKPQDSPGWEGETGLVTQAVERHVKNAPQAEAYLCGSPGMIDASIAVLRKLGMTEDRIFYDKFS